MSSPNPKLPPEWAMFPFQNFREEVLGLSELLQVSIAGISSLPRNARLMEALNKHAGDFFGEPIGNTELSRVRTQADLANGEIEKGFPLLHSWATVALWAYLESLFRLITASLIQNKSSLLATTDFEKIPLNVAQYFGASRSQRPELLAEAIERKLSKPGGVGRFESVLKPFELSGEVPKWVRETIFEFNKVRNLAAHRSLVVDNKFVEDCPFLESEIGERFCVSPKRFENYAIASFGYSQLVYSRLGESLDVDMSDCRKVALEMLRMHEEKSQTD